MQKPLAIIFLLLIFPELTFAASLSELQIRTSRGELVSNCFPGAEFSFQTNDFSHNRGVYYDVIIREPSSLMVRKLTSIRPKRAEQQRIVFSCPKVKKTVRAYIRPHAISSINPSREILFSTGLIPSIYNIEFSESILRFTSNIRTGKISINLEGMPPIHQTATSNGRYAVRIPSQFTSGDIHISNVHGVSNRYPLNAAFQVALRTNNLPVANYHIYDNDTQSIVPLTTMSRVTLEYGKLNKVSIYHLDANGTPIVYATAYYLAGESLTVSPETTAASVIFDTFCTTSLSLVERQAIYRFILESNYLQPLISHLKKRSPSASESLFEDKRSREIISILRARYQPHISQAYLGGA